MKNYTDENELREEKSADEIIQEEIAPALACAQDDREEIAQDASLKVVSEADGQEKAQKDDFVPRKGFRYGCYRFVKRTFDILSSGCF